MQYPLSATSARGTADPEAPREALAPPEEPDGGD